MRRKLIASLLLLLTTIASYGQNYDLTQAQMPEGRTIVFRFVADNDTFYIPYQGNGDKLAELVATIDHYKCAITAGQAQINVDGYCSSYATAEENLKSAGVRANRVKSELILRNSIAEASFVTTVHATPFEGRKSVVVVTLRVPQIEEPQAEPKPKPAVEQPKPVVEKPEPQAVIEEVAPEDGISKQVAVPKTRYLALRTNLLYDALAVPNLGIEWRLNESWGIKVDAGGSDWGSETGNVQKLWYVNPEVRYYVGSAKRLYTGISGNYGEYNIYKGVLGNLFSKDTGYQGTMWNTGAVVGYQLPLGRAFAVDFNLGLGYNSFSYDSFNIINQTRVYKEKDVTKNSFGVTQAGISLLWKFCK